MQNMLKAAILGVAISAAYLPLVAIILMYHAS